MEEEQMLRQWFYLSTVESFALYLFNPVCLLSSKYGHTHVQLIHQNTCSKEWVVCVTSQDPQSNRPQEMPQKLKRAPKRVPKHNASETWVRGGAAEHECVLWRF